MYKRLRNCLHSLEREHGARITAPIMRTVRFSNNIAPSPSVTIKPAGQVLSLNSQRETSVPPLNLAALIHDAMKQVQIEVVPD